MIEQHSYSGDYTNRYKFNGKELDEETGFYYYGARYYNPKFSIWLSVDPLAEIFPNWNPYNYTMQNPINLTDPDGMQVEPPDWYLSKDNKNIEFHEGSGEREGFVNLGNNRDVTIDNKYKFSLNSDGSFIEHDPVGDFKYGLGSVVERGSTTFTHKINFSIVDFLISLDSAMQGTSTTHAYEGIDGMYNSADMLDNIGSDLSCIPGVSQVFGKITSGFADGLKTIADFNGGVTKEQAKANLAVRGATTIVGEKIGKSITTAGFSKEKEYIFDQAARILTDEVKNQTTTKPKE